MSLDHPLVMSDLILLVISDRVLHFPHTFPFVIFFDQFLVTGFCKKFAKFLYFTGFSADIKNLTGRKVAGRVSCKNKLAKDNLT